MHISNDLNSGELRLGMAGSGRTPNCSGLLRLWCGRSLAPARRGMARSGSTAYSLWLTTAQVRLRCGTGGTAEVRQWCGQALESCVSSSKEPDHAHTSAGVGAPELAIAKPDVAQTNFAGWVLAVERPLVIRQDRQFLLHRLQLYTVVGHRGWSAALTALPDWDLKRLGIDVPAAPSPAPQAQPAAAAAPAPPQQPLSYPATTVAYPLHANPYMFAQPGPPRRRRRRKPAAAPAAQ